MRGGNGQVYNILHFPAPTPKVRPRPASRPERGVDDADSPLDAFAATATIGDVLEPAGWSYVKSEKDGAELWLRPGEDVSSAYSARWNRGGVPTLVVFSESAGLPTGAGRQLTLPRVFAQLHHDGDLSAATRDLIAASRGEECTEAAAGLPEGVLEAIRQAAPTEADAWAGAGINIRDYLTASGHFEDFEHQIEGVSASQPPGAGGFEDFEHQNRGSAGAAVAPEELSFEDFEAMFLAGRVAPVPLPGQTQPLVLPSSCPDLSDFVTELADALQVPVDMPMTMALPVLAAATGGNFEVQVQPGWIEPLSLCAVVCQGSGERKSPVLSKLEHVVKDHQRMAQEQALPTYRAQETKAQLAKKRFETAMGKAGKSDDLEAEFEALRLREAWATARGALVPLPTWIVGADGTPEAFVDLIIQHKAIGIITSEPGLFATLAGRYSSGSPNIEWFLNATSRETLDPRRITRETGAVEHPVLSALSCIQPGRLRELGEVKAFRDSGLLARHFYCIAPSMLGTRQRTRAVSEELTHGWETRVKALLAKKKINLGSPTILPCTEAAAELLRRFDDELEPQLTPHVGRYADIADWIGKAVGATARIAGLFTLFNDAEASTVDVEATSDAIALVRSYISHTIAAFGLIDPAADLHKQAEEILATAGAVCEKESRVWFTRREVHQKIRRRKWATESNALDGPLGLLSAHGFIHKQRVIADGVGRPSERYLLNPAKPIARSVPAPSPRPARGTPPPRKRCSKSSKPD